MDACMLCLGQPGIFSWRAFEQAPLCAGHWMMLSKDDRREVERYFQEERKAEEARGDLYNGKPAVSDEAWAAIWRRFNP